jgi:hypothetical protein
VSLPDRLGRDPPTELLHPALYTTLLRRMLSSMHAHRSTATPFVGAIVTSMCRRGYAAVVAEVLVPYLLQATAATSQESLAAAERVCGTDEWGSLAAEVVDGHAAELLVKALLHALRAARVHDDVAVRTLQVPPRNAYAVPAACVRSLSGTQAPSAMFLFRVHNGGVCSTARRRCCTVTRCKLNPTCGCSSPTNCWRKRCCRVDVVGG